MSTEDIVPASFDCQVPYVQARSLDIVKSFMDTCVRATEIVIIPSLDRVC